MAVVINDTTGQLAFADDPTALLQQGWRIPSPEEADKAAQTIDLSTPGQQALAQGERVVRGLSFGQIPGLTPESPEDIRPRADVSRETSPALSAIADIAPAVAVGAVTGGAGGLLTGAGRAAGAAALEGGAGLLGASGAAQAAGGLAGVAGEALGAGAVQGAQQAFDEGRYFGDDPGRDAEHVLLWSGINFGLGSVLRVLGHGAEAEQPVRVAAGATERAAPAATLDDIARAAEDRAATTSAPEPAPMQVSTADVHMRDEEGYLAPVEPNDPRLVSVTPEIEKVAREGIVGKSIEDLRALPLDQADRPLIEQLKQDRGFLESGNVQDNFGSARGGLPRLNLFPEEDGTIGLNLANGRHRVSAAREAGMDTLQFQIVKYDADGNTLWDYVGPMRIAEPATPAASAAATRVTERAAVDDSFERALRESQRSEADDIVKRAIGSEPVPEVNSFARQRSLYQNREAIMDVATRELQGDLTELVNRARTVAGKGKIADVASNVGDNLAAQRAASDGIAQSAAEFAGTLRGEARAFAAESELPGLHYPVPENKGLVQALKDHAKALTEAKGGRALFEAGDEFKRVLDDIKVSLEKGADNSDNPFHHQQLIPRVADFAKKLRASLEDATVWGRAGEMQGAYNAVIHDQLLPSMRIFEESALKRVNQTYEGLWKFEGWETKLRGLLEAKDLGRARHVDQVLGALDQLGDLRARYGDTATGEQIQGLVGKVRRTLKLGADVQDASERMQAAGKIAGMLPLVGGVTKEWVTGDLSNAFRRLSGATDAAIDKGVDDWIQSSQVRGQRGVFSNLGSAMRPAAAIASDPLVAMAARRGLSLTMAKFMGDDQTPHAAFARAREALLSDEKFYAAMGGDWKALQANAPEVYMMLAGRAADARQLLTERMPANVAVSMMRPMGYPPARNAVEDWAVYWNAVRRPVDVVKNLASVRIQEIETLKRIAPRLYERTQQRVLERISQASASGRPLDDALLMRLDLLFGGGLAATAHPIFSRGTVDLVRQYNQLNAQQAQPTSSKPPKPPPPGPAATTLQYGATFGSG